MKQLNMAQSILTLILASVAVGPLAAAEGAGGKPAAIPPGSPGYEISAEMQHYREIAGLMRDMSRQMNIIQEGMAKGEMSPEKRKRMQQQLKEMSEMMARMTVVADRPAMNDPRTRKQTEEMRKQMDNMMRTQP